MELGSIFMLLAVVLLVGIYVSSPLFTRLSARDKPENAEPKADENAFIPVEINNRDHLRSSLLADYDRLLNSLQELEFDHALGKIPPEDYPKQRALLMQSGAEVLQKLDAIQAATPVSDGIDPSISKTAVERFTAAVQAKLAADSRTTTMMTTTPLPSPTSEADVAGFSGANGAPSGQTAVQPASLDQAGQSREGSAAMSDADLELIISAHRQARHEKASGFCPKCGKPVQKSDRFCPKCGKAL